MGAANRSTRRRLPLRLIAVGIGLLPLVVVEGVLRIGGWGRPEQAVDPFVTFVDVPPLFELDPATDRYGISPRRELFRPDSFRRRKGAREFRIFCLGGSTVQGRPFSIETAFSSWLELDLRAADPARDWEVVNCGGVSYASYRLVPILRELLAHEPDLIILYTGHNEFLEERTYRDVQAVSPVVARWHRRLMRFRSYNVFRGLLQGDARRSRETSDRAVLATEVEALLDYRGGLAEYHRDDELRRKVVQHYAFNVRSMVDEASRAGVPVILVDPVANLKDTPPFKVEREVGLTSAERAEFERLSTRAGSLDLPLAARIESLQAALVIDPRNAGAWFRLGRMLLAEGQVVAARAALVRAKDEDICPLRMTEGLHRALRAVAAETGAALVDARELFAGKTPDGVPGDEWLVDHVHPSIPGHRELAVALRSALRRAGLLDAAPPPDFAERREAAHRAHLQGLDPVYYIKGRQQLEGLRLWAQGRSSRLRRPERKR